VSGVWTKKAEGIYETTDGKLEAEKTNGAVSVILPKTNSEVKIYVRRAGMTGGSPYVEFGSGFGFKIEGSLVKLFTPFSRYSGINAVPFKEREIQLKDAPRTKFTVSVNDNVLEYYINDKREKQTSFKINRDGPIVIEVGGTA